MSVLRRVLLDIFLTTSFTTSSFGNTSGMRVIFFLNMLNFWASVRKYNEKFEKKFFISGIIAFELVVVYSHGLEENTGHRQLFC